MESDTHLFRKSILVLIVCLLLAFLLLAYPIYVIRPFRYQGPTELSVALAVTRIRPVAQIILSLGALLSLIWAWRAARRGWQKVVAAVCFLVVLGFAALSRVNIYELMFHPMQKPEFSSAAKSTLDGREQVIAVRVNGTARAYPIRIISYHHIVNDVVGGVPIVATY